MTRLLDPLLRTDAMRDAFSDRAHLQGMLDFEAALARVEARLGVIPKAAAPAIAAQCRAALFDIEALAQAAAPAGNTAIPLVKALTARVAKGHPRAAGYVHWGATSQDALDTGLMLQLRRALALVDADLKRLAEVLARLAKKYRRTPMAGRTWMQQALPVTFGLKAAGALDAVQRHRAQLRDLRERVLVIQFGGAAGTLASLGKRGPAVARALAAELKLRDPDMPWHAHRDRVAQVATTLGLLVGTLGKIARDVALMAQTEVGETLEAHAPGRGASSTLPHKRNPVGCAVVLAAATRVPALVSAMLAAMVQEHERALGAWHAEWETLPEICMLTAGALQQTVQMLAGLQIDAARMRHNLGATHGLILAEAVAAALAPKLGRETAHGLVEEACHRALEHGETLREVLAQDARVGKLLSAAELDRLCDPNNYLGAAGQFVDRALASRTGRTRKT
jgi:3-carboxy-cis,cis-muconate cycloisomerase